MSGLSEIVSTDFLLTTLLVTLLPGTGVIYTLSVGLFRSRTSSMAAVAGCTISIVPHLMASVFGLAALLHTSALLFGLIKYAGVIYLLYLAWGMWRDRSTSFNTDAERESAGEEASSLRAIAMRGILINLLNPKLTLFFLAFLPQFVPHTAEEPRFAMFVLATLFMLMTFGVFTIYGLFAAQVRDLVLSSERTVIWMRRLFAAGFAAFAVKLATTHSGD
ncbi:LysE family translocator [Nisaea sediminum]|uniref:LysE family translocator n=1 Tax=Nisaea sediminum TaxID=2775867 RepID=UPI001D01EC42|nr:LysE family translocator [Nisaea sediminum]